MLWSAFKWGIKIVSIMMRSPSIIHIVFIASSHYKVAPLTLETTASSPVRGPSLSTCSHTYPQVMSGKSGGISTTIFHFSYKPKPKAKAKAKERFYKHSYFITLPSLMGSDGMALRLDTKYEPSGYADELQKEKKHFLL
ncbi:hypothetical protein SAY87_011253 [Trapa incisa]|uniref:Uncharacterized protein n=1 Tax=Trapa incisa TaxID=236973 RepID=A0AAN7GFU1_9MYRT|nr:hypothetical protein SAY87_011253 [Trapa incisa]